MTSWQSKSLKAYYRLDRLLHPPKAELDVDRERAWLEATLARYGPKVDLQSSIVQAGGVPAEWVVPPRAPEHRFPAALQDAQTAYAWLLDQGIAPEHVALAGDSAGGGLVLALMVSLRDAGQPLPAAAVCLSPWTDLAMSGRSWTTNARRELVVSPAILRQMGQVYLGDTDPRTPLASPLYADLAGLPPLLVQVGGDEGLLSDGEEVALRARAAGVDVELEVWPGMWHVWQLTSRFVPEGRKAIEQIGAFLQPRIAGAA
jgi:monoterpene epsilon-lactone hydrolase